MSCTNICSENADLSNIVTLPCSNCAPDYLVRNLPEDVFRCGFNVEDAPEYEAITVTVDQIDEATGASVEIDGIADVDGNDFDVEAYAIAPGTYDPAFLDSIKSTPDALDVDATWRAIRTPAKTLAEVRTLLVGSSRTEDIGILEGEFIVTNDDGITVARFDDLDDARLFLSVRSLVEIAAKEASRADLAESRVRGLEGTLRAMREYDRENPSPDLADACCVLDLEPADDEFENGDRYIRLDSHNACDDDGCECGGTDLRPFYLDGRESRSLAASALRAADAYDAALLRR